MEVKEQLKELEEKVSLGLQGAYKKMAEFKKMKKSPLIVSENGRVIEIQSEDILSTTSAKNPVG